MSYLSDRVHFFYLRVYTFGITVRFYFKPYKLISPHSGKFGVDDYFNDSVLKVIFKVR